MSTEVLLLGSSIREHVVSVPRATIEGGLFGQVLINPIPSLVGNNVRGFWDARRQSSPFYGEPDLSMFPIEILEGGVQVFTGSVLSIAEDGAARTANVALRSAYQAILERGLTYVSQSNEETPARAALNLLATAGIATHAGSFNQAEAYYSTNAIYVRVNPQLSGSSPIPSATNLDVLGRLAEIGLARIYLGAENRIYFDAFDPSADPVPPVYTFTNRIQQASNSDTLFSPPPGKDALQKELIDAFYVEWAGPPSLAAAAGNQDSPRIKSISGNADQIVAITSAQAAERIGQSWRDYSRRPQYVVTVSVPVRIARQLSVGAVVRIDYTKWGTPLDIAITSINTAQPPAAVLTGVTF